MNLVTAIEGAQKEVCDNLNGRDMVISDSFVDGPQVLGIGVMKTAGGEVIRVRFFFARRCLHHTNTIHDRGPRGWAPRGWAPRGSSGDEDTGLGQSHVAPRALAHEGVSSVWGSGCGQ